MTKNKPRFNQGAKGFKSFLGKFNLGVKRNYTDNSLNLLNYNLLLFSDGGGRRVAHQPKEAAPVLSKIKQQLINRQTSLDR